MPAVRTETLGCRSRSVLEFQGFLDKETGAIDLCPALLWAGSVTGEDFGLQENSSLKK